jgi:hypothetical protein
MGDRIRARSYWLTAARICLTSTTRTVFAVDVWFGDAEHLDPGFVNSNHERLLQDEITRKAVEAIDDEPGHLARLHDGQNFGQARASV